MAHLLPPVGLALVLLAGCARLPVPVEAPATARPAAPVEPPPDELTLARTACSGRCPVYTLSVRRDGRVHFVGERDVAAPGEHDWRMEPLFARHLFTELERAGFERFAERYPTEVEEFPGLVLTLVRDGVRHRVQLGGAGTEELARDVPAERLLQRLAQTIDQLTASARFVALDAKPGAGCVER